MWFTSWTLYCREFCSDYDSGYEHVYNPAENIHGPLRLPASWSALSGLLYFTGCYGLALTGSLPDSWSELGRLREIQIGRQSFDQRICETAAMYTSKNNLQVF